MAEANVADRERDQLRISLGLQSLIPKTGKEKIWTKNKHEVILN